MCLDLLLVFIVIDGIIIESFFNLVEGLSS